MPTLSVVTPVFNSGDYLEQLLDSVAAIRHEHEHLVLDAESTDGTVELLKAREDPALSWVSEPDRGQTHAVNKGLARATGEIVNWINGDNAYIPDAVDRALDLLDERPEIDAVFGGFDFIDEHGRFRRRYIPGPWNWHRYLFIGDYIPTETIFFRRSLLDHVPALDESFRDAADYDFYLRLFHRRNIVRLAEPMILYRFHPASKTASDPWLAQREHGQIRERWAANAGHRLAMRSVQQLKWTVLPRISSWPRPYPD